MINNIVGVDRHALQERRKQLVEELTVIDNVLKFIENGAQQITPTPAQPTAHTKEPLPRQKRTSIMGARKAILLALHTGPLSYNDLKRGLVWDDHKLKGSLFPAVNADFVGVNSTQKYYLTTKGKAAVTWFLQHPSYVAYCPKKAVHV